MRYEDSRVEVHRLVVGPIDNNVFIVRCKETGEAALIDAANEHDKLLETATSLNVRTILETHGHWDHIQAIPSMRAAGFEVGVTKADASMLPSYDYIIDDEDVITIGNLHLRAIATPGHTPGSVCFALSEAPVLFSGDTLFPGGPGATHFEGGDFNTIIDSIDRRLFAQLAPETVVMPGHGSDTTIRNESPSLESWVSRGW